jgi:hypothetical protein
VSFFSSQKPHEIGKNSSRSELLEAVGHQKKLVALNCKKESALLKKRLKIIEGQYLGNGSRYFGCVVFSPEGIFQELILKNVTPKKKWGPQTNGLKGPSHQIRYAKK